MRIAEQVQDDSARELVARDADDDSPCSAQRDELMDEQLLVDSDTPPLHGRAQRVSSQLADTGLPVRGTTSPPACSTAAR
jgi:hypothetical protein